MAVNRSDVGHAAHLEAALNAPEPFAAIWALAVALRDGGMSQTDLYALFDAARDRHDGDADQCVYDAVLDVMDFIIGWCSRGQELYPLGPDGDICHPPSEAK